MRTTDIVRRRRARARQANGRGPQLARAVATAVLAVTLAGIFAPAVALAGGAAALLAFVRDLPDVETLRELPDAFAPAPATTRLYAYDAPGAGGLRQPVLIDEIADPRAGGAGWLSLADLPPAVVDATLAAADPAFFERPPLDLAAAVSEWARTGRVTQVVSPLLAELIATHLHSALDPTLDLPATPQDAKRERLVTDEAASGDRITRRMLQDFFLAWQIERRFGREQALEWTLNTTYYGHLAYGIEAASRRYFGTGAADLTVTEAALLAAVARAPLANPFDNPEAAQAATAAVLATMAAQGLVDASAAPADALLRLSVPPGATAGVPAFARLARAELERVLGPDRLVRGGLQVETTLDLSLQAQATCVVAAASGQGEPVGGRPPCPASETLASTDRRAMSAAVVALDVPTGAILALAGDDPLAVRPVGTLARPFIALSALSQGYTAASLTYDVERIYLEDGRPYVPPSDGQYLGPLRLREAVAMDRAAPAAQMLSWVGVGRVLENVRALGATGYNATAGLAFAQSGFSSDLLGLSHALATIGNGGTLAGMRTAGSPRPATIVRVLDARGVEIYALAADGRQALSPELAWLMTDMLRRGDDAVALATGRSAEGGDWAIGLSPRRLVGVWAGGEADESNAARPVWEALFAPVADEADEWPRPAGLRAVDVCALSGLLPARDGPECPTVREWFVAGTEPVAADTMTRAVAVNRETERLATIFTPPGLIESRVYPLYPPEAAAWAQANDIPTVPVEYDTIRRVPAREGAAAVTSPEPWSVVRGLSPVLGTATGPNLVYYRLAYFPGLMPEAMQPLVERGETAIEDGELGIWDTNLLEDGLYTLLLTVVRADGTFDEVAIPLTVANE